MLCESIDRHCHCHFVTDTVEYSIGLGLLNTLNQEFFKSITMCLVCSHVTSWSLFEHR